MAQVKGLGADRILTREANLLTKLGESSIDAIIDNVKARRLRMPGFLGGVGSLQKAVPLRLNRDAVLPGVVEVDAGAAAQQ